MTPGANRALVLIGPMGAGKTSVGRRVARALDLPFVDTDKLIVRDHGPIPEVFAAHGEPHFRALERAAVAEALAEGGVVALGGGAILDADTRADLGAHRVVLLTVAPHIVAGRIQADSRPLVAGDDPVGRWQRIFLERRALYEDLADITFDTSSGPLATIVADVVAWAQSENPTEENA